MTVLEAIRASAGGVAERGDRLATIAGLPRESAGVRIVRSYTDPTVVRKLTAKELTATDWRPVEA